MRDPGLPPQLTIDNRVATITLSRPEVANRLDDNDLATLMQHFETIDEHQEVLVCRLQAKGKYFCSGYNVDSFAERDPNAPRVDFEQVADRLEALRPITLAVIQGGLYGGATDLALACDFRLGLRATEMFVPAARLGLHFYRGGMERMVSRLGLDQAKRILLLAERMNADEMLASGFLTALFNDAAELQEEVDELTESLCNMGPLALLPMKQHLNALGHGGIDPAQFAADYQRAGSSEDLAEGARAWREKRKPAFRGR